MILGTPAGSLHTCPEARCKLSLHLDPACRALEKKKNEQKKKRRKKRKKIPPSFEAAECRGASQMDGWTDDSSFHDGRAGAPSPPRLMVSQEEKEE